MIQRPNRFIPGLTSMDLQERAIFHGKIPWFLGRPMAVMAEVIPPMLDTSGIDSTVKAAAARKTVQSSGLGRIFLIKQRCFEDV